MRHNDLHPETLPRRLRHLSLMLDPYVTRGASPELPAHLRQMASHEEKMARIWEGDDPEERTAQAHLHEIWQHRRNARRLCELADAIEREQTGPWCRLDHPFVHLSEARPARQEEEVAH